MRSDGAYIRDPAMTADAATVAGLAK